jgi:hypothetical protein
MSQGHGVADPTSSFTPVLTQALAATDQRLKRHAKQGLEFRFKEVNSSTQRQRRGVLVQWHQRKTNFCTAFRPKGILDLFHRRLEAKADGMAWETKKKKVKCHST